MPVGKKVRGLDSDPRRESDTNATWALRTSVPDVVIYSVKATTANCKMAWQHILTE